MHAPWSDRGPWVQALRDEIAPHVGKFEVVTDDQREGVWATARRAWQSHSNRATHICVLQDDAQVVDGFIDHVTRALAVKHDVPVGLCSSLQARSQKILDEGCHWLPVMGFYWGIAQILPVWYVRPWLRWCDKTVDPSSTYDDVRLALYLLKHGVPMWLTVPSLATSLGDRHSLIGHSVDVAQRVHFTRALPRIDWTRGAGRLPARINTFANVAKRCRVQFL